LNYNILLLPLLGGFLFIKNTNYYRFRAIRYNNQELLLFSAVAGLCGLVPAYLFTILMTALFPSFVEEWQSTVAFSYLGTGLLAFSILIIAILFERWYHDEEDMITGIIKEENDAMESIYLKSLQSQKLLSLTLRNNKVYVGFISQHFFTPYQPLQSVKIIPVVSGWRNKKHLQVSFETVYDPIVNFVDKSEFINLDINDFEIGIPISEIVSVNVFDFRIYNMFQEADSGQQQFDFK